MEIAPALIISIFNLKRDTAVAAEDDVEWTKIRTRTFGGFVLEMGDVAEHGSFDAFCRHMRAGDVSAKWNEEKALLDVV